MTEPRSPREPPGPQPNDLPLDLLAVASPIDLTPRRSKRSALLLATGAFAVVALCVVALVVYWANRQFRSIPTFAEKAPGYVNDATTFPPETAPPGTVPVDVGQGVSAPPSVAPPVKRGTTFLLFSTGSQGLTSADAQRLNIPADRATMADGLTDSILVVTVYAETGQVGILSIPRDLYIPGLNDRINTIFVRAGPRALAQTVARMTGLPVDHMVAVNFTAFGELTDAVGGVDVWVDGPARDLNTGFEVAASGCVHMDGTRALEFARSRHWEVMDAAGWRLDYSASDFGRIKRQQALVRAATKKLASPAGLTMLGGAIGVAQRTLTVDPDLDFGTVSNLGLDMLRSDRTTIHTFSYAGTPGWAGPASVVFTDAGANARTLAAMQRLLAGQPVDTSAGGEPAGVSAGADPAQPSRACS